MSPTWERGRALIRGGEPEQAPYREAEPHMEGGKPEQAQLGGASLNKPHMEGQALMGPIWRGKAEWAPHKRV